MSVSLVDSERCMYGACQEHIIPVHTYAGNGAQPAHKDESEECPWWRLPPPPLWVKGTWAVEKKDNVW